MSYWFHQHAGHEPFAVPDDLYDMRRADEILAAWVEEQGGEECVTGWDGTPLEKQCEDILENRVKSSILRVYGEQPGKGESGLATLIRGWAEEADGRPISKTSAYKWLRGELSRHALAVIACGLARAMEGRGTGHDGGKADPIDGADGCNTRAGEPGELYVLDYSRMVKVKDLSGADVSVFPAVAGPEYSYVMNLLTIGRDVYEETRAGRLACMDAVCRIDLSDLATVLPVLERFTARPKTSKAVMRDPAAPDAVIELDEEQAAYREVADEVELIRRWLTLDAGR